MAKLCPKGKAAAKRKFKVYPSAYANMYASKVCKGKVRASAKFGGSISDVPTDPETGALSLSGKKLKMAKESGHVNKGRDKKTGRIIYTRSPLKKSGPFEGLKIQKQRRDRKTRKIKAEGGRVNKKNGGSAAEHYLQHGYGPHKSVGIAKRGFGKIIK
jgi:hypothetical protein